MELIVVIIFTFIMIAGQISKGKNNRKNIGEERSQNVIPQTNNTYNAVYQSNNQGKPDKAFREASRLTNGKSNGEELAASAFAGFTESFEKKKATKSSKKPLEVKKEIKDETVKYVDVSKNENPTITEETASYGWGIFDDFAASDALYLAKRDVESRKSGNIMQN